ncbi:MAG: TonB-dependent receptor [Bacteroidota bacterium]
MRLLLLSFWTLTLLLSANLYAQKYSYSSPSKPLGEVLQELTSTYDLKLSFDPGKVAEHQVDGNYSGKNPNDLLNAIFNDLPFKVKKTGSVFLIVPSKRVTQNQFSGRIIDQSSKQPLAYAYIQIGDDASVLTDQNGRYRFSSFADSARLSIRYVGYEAKDISVKAGQSISDIKMRQDPTMLPDFVLDDHRASDNTSIVSQFSINPAQINSIPALGEPDVFKSLQLLPGIRATDESSSGLVVRGSAPEQNLVLLDGFTLYQLDHFFGIFSTFNPNTINHVDIYKGGFMARYGGRVSSVVDATAKSANRDGFAGGVGLNMTSVNGYVEVPIGENLGLMFGARRSHNTLLNSRVYQQFLTNNRVDILQAQEPEFEQQEITLNPEFDFYDMSGKLRWRPSENSIVDLNFFASEDDYFGSYEAQDDFSLFGYEDVAYWGNLGMSALWNQTWNERHNSLLTLSLSSYDSYSLSDTEALFLEFEEFDGEEDFDEDDPLEEFVDTVYVAFALEKDNKISDLTADWQHEIKTSDESSMLFGAALTLYETVYNITYRDEDGQFSDSINNNASLSSLYTEYRTSPGQWRFNFGLRYNYYDILNRVDFEPRISGAFQINDNLTLSAAWSHHHQYINRLSLSPFGNSDQYYWVVSDDEIPVLFSQHFIGGISYRNDHWQFDLEGYYKNSSGLLESEFVLFAQEAADEEEAFGDGENFAYGLDIFAKYRSDRFTTWFSYALGFSENQFPGIKFGERYWSLYDQRHEFNQVNMVKLGPWEFSSIFVLGSGSRYTPALPILEDETFVYDIDLLNDLQLPMYHRLDMSIKRTFEAKRMRFETGFTLFNVYNRQNIKSRRYTGTFEFNEEEDEAEFRIQPVDIALLGITPNFFLNIHFR